MRLDLLIAFNLGIYSCILLIMLGFMTGAFGS